MSDRLVAAFKGKESILKAISAYLKREGAGDLSDAERSSLGGLLELAAQVVREMKGICQGVHIMAIGWEAEVPQILKAAGVR